LAAHDWKFRGWTPEYVKLLLPPRQSRGVSYVWLALSHAEQEYDAFHGQHIAENADRPDDFEKSIQQLPAAKPKRKKKGGK
jgi:hypothetical protein